MIDLRPVLFMIGWLMLTMGIAMIIPALADVAANNPDWITFAVSSFLTIFVAGAIILGCRTDKIGFDTRQAFLFSSLSWASVSLVGSLPFFFQANGLSFTDSLFESVSGITTTCSTVVTGLAAQPPGILLWRSILSWLGGFGIILLAIALLPNIQLGGMQLFRMELPDQRDKIMPRVTEISKIISVIYLFFTVLCAVLYYAAGMPAFDAINHAMTTVATAGYSTHDSSIGGFDSAAIEWIAIVFMVLGSLPFLLYFQAVCGRTKDLIDDPQVKTFIGIVSALALVIAVILMFGPHQHNLHDAVRLSLCNIVSIVSGTGYASADYGQWGNFVIAVFFFATFIGGCGGSTGCGVKIFRWRILAATVQAELQRIMQPHQVRQVVYNGRKLDNSVIESVMVFMFVFFLTFAIMAVLLAMTGLDTITALSGAATSISNVGPGLGPIIGPSGNFAPLHDSSKWILITGMLLGRLEFLALLVLFRRQFWQD